MILETRMVSESEREKERKKGRVEIRRFTMLEAVNEQRRVGYTQNDPPSLPHTHTHSFFLKVKSLA